MLSVQVGQLGSHLSSWTEIKLTWIKETHENRRRLGYIVTKFLGRKELQKRYIYVTDSGPDGSVLFPPLVGRALFCVTNRVWKTVHVPVTSSCVL